MHTFMLGIQDAVVGWILGTDVLKSQLKRQAATGSIRFRGERGPSASKCDRVKETSLLEFEY